MYFCKFRAQKWFKRASDITQESGACLELDNSIKLLFRFENTWSAIISKKQGVCGILPGTSGGTAGYRLDKVSNEFTTEKHYSFRPPEPAKKVSKSTVFEIFLKATTFWFWSGSTFQISEVFGYLILERSLGP